MPTVHFSEDLVTTTVADTVRPGSTDTDVTEEGRLSDSGAFSVDRKNDKSTASVTRNSVSTHVRRNVDNSRRRRRSSAASFFNDISHSLYYSVVDPVIDSLRDEEFRDEASSVSSSSFNADDYFHVPYLDDTMVTYNTRTRSGKWRKRFGAIVNHPYTQRVVLLLITANAVLMGVMTFDVVQDNPDVMSGLILVDWVFLALFAVEVIMQLIWHGRAALGNPWLMFDVGILCCSWVPELRIFRFARVINRLEILQNLTRAIALVMPRMFSIALFLFIVIYTYSVLFTELFRDVQFEDGVGYFESLPASMFTCFEMMTLEWAHIARGLQNQNFSWLPVTTFVVICGVIFFNLVLAVICDAVAVLGVDWSGRNAMERQTLKELQGQIADAQHRVHRLKILMTQLVKNQRNTLYLLEVQLAKQLNNVEALSDLCNSVEKKATRTSLTTRQGVLIKLTQDYKFREHNLITKLRIISGIILESDYFELFIFIVICTDCVLMGVATFDAVNESEFWLTVLDRISFGFLIIYTVEAVMGFVYLGRGVFSDPWMAFDVFIVVTSWIADLLQGLKTFREFRAVRIVRAFRLIAVLHTLRDLVAAIGTAIPRVSRVMPLVLLIFYVFAVLFVELFRDVQYDDGVSYFGRLDDALFTCLQMMTMEWAELARESIQKTGLRWASCLFVTFVMVAGMLFFDLIKATVCDSVAVINGRSRRLAEIKKCRKRIKMLAKTVDNLSRQVSHTLNFQNHINRMMMNDLQNLASKKDQTQQVEQISKSDQGEGDLAFRESQTSDRDDEANAKLKHSDHGLSEDRKGSSNKVHRSKRDSSKTLPRRTGSIQHAEERSQEESQSHLRRRSLGTTVDSRRVQR